MIHDNGESEMEHQRDALLHTALFKQVRPDEADLLLPHLQRRYYAKGDAVFREGDTDHRLYLLENGRVKLIRESSDHRIHLLSIHGRGEVLGEIPVFDPTGGPRTASAIVMTNGTVVSSLERSAIFAWLDEHPRVAIDMLQVMGNRARLNNERITDLVFADVPGRLAKTLIDLAQRFGEPSEDGLVVPHDLTQEEMAQLVGASRETVNKALMEFTQRGWISRKGRTIIIYQPGKLIRRAHQ